MNHLDARVEMWRMGKEQVLEETGQLLFELAPRLTRVENAVLGALPRPLTFRQYRLLSRVHSGSSTLSQLRAPSTLSLAAVSESVDGLVQRGLLARQADPSDRRAVTLSTTNEGEAALQDASAALAQLASTLVADLRLEDADELHQVLARVLERVTVKLRDPQSRTPAIS